MLLFKLPTSVTAHDSKNSDLMNSLTRTSVICNSVGHGHIAISCDTTVYRTDDGVFWSERCSDQFSNKPLSGVRSQTCYLWDLRALVLSQLCVKSLYCIPPLHCGILSKSVKMATQLHSMWPLCPTLTKHQRLWRLRSVRIALNKPTQVVPSLCIITACALWAARKNSPHGESNRSHCKECAKVSEKLSGPGNLHSHLSLSHLVLHQDLTFHLFTQENRKQRTSSGITDL